MGGRISSNSTPHLTLAEKRYRVSPRHRRRSHHKRDESASRLVAVDGEPSSRYLWIVAASATSTTFSSLDACSDRAAGVPAMPLRNALSSTAISAQTRRRAPMRAQRSVDGVVQAATAGEPITVIVAPTPTPPPLSHRPTSPPSLPPPPRLALTAQQQQMLETNWKRSNRVSHLIVETSKFIS